MQISKWRYVLNMVRRSVERTLGLSSKVAVGTVVSLSAAPKADAPSMPKSATENSWPSLSQDTVRRYHEKFILTPADSIVVRSDTVWYPRSKRSTISKTTRDTASRTTPQYPSSGTTNNTSGGYGGGYGGHMSHVSHASHSSHRSGGWV